MTGCDRTGGGIQFHGRVQEEAVTKHIVNQTALPLLMLQKYFFEEYLAPVLGVARYFYLIFKRRLWS